MRKLWLQIILLITILIMILTCSKCSKCGKQCRCKFRNCKKLKCHSKSCEPHRLRELSECIIHALDREELETVAHHVDEEAGLLFSPYVYVKDDAVVFSKNEVATLLDTNQKYIWGEYDGTGATMKLTPREYMTEIVNVSLYQNPDVVTENVIQERGGTINNIRTKFPQAEFIEFYRDGTEANSQMDWSSLYLVYSRDDTNHLKLMAIIRDVWTI